MTTTHLKIPIHELFYSKAGTMDQFEINLPEFSDAEVLIPDGQKIVLTGIKIDDAVCMYTDNQEIKIEYQCARCLCPVKKTLALKTLEKQFYVNIPEDIDPDLVQEVETKNFEIDLLPMLKETIFLSLDPVLICGENCPGMPSYSNEQAGTSQTNTFSKLKDLLK